MSHALHLLWRRILALRRPSARANRRKLSARGESVDALRIRDARPDDIPALAALHVKTWNAAYRGMVRHYPSLELRERQWRDAFANDGGGWFALVVERPDGELVGFLKGSHADAPGAPAELSKLHLLPDYQRLGLGRRLIGIAAARFHGRGATSMHAFVDPRNPSCGFFERLGGEHARDADGRISYTAYVWRDLQPLAAESPSSDRV